MPAIRRKPTVGMMEIHTCTPSGEGPHHMHHSSGLRLQLASIGELCASARATRALCLVACLAVSASPFFAQLPSTPLSLTALNQGPSYSSSLPASSLPD